MIQCEIIQTERLPDAHSAQGGSLGAQKLVPAAVAHGAIFFTDRDV